MLKKIFKYGVAGGSAFVIDFAIVYCLFTYTNLHYAISVPLAFAAGTIVNYTINRIWVFKGTTRTIGRGYWYFLQIAIVGVLITLGLMWAFATWSDQFILRFAGVDIAENFQLLVNVLSNYFMQNLAEIAIIMLISGVALGGISSYIAAKRYLKV